jgi:hypothetical protein
MKKTLSLILIVLLVSPAFASWLPHGMIHALHHNSIEHLLTGSHHHSPQEYNHDTGTHLSDHHPTHIDVVTYFSDYLNADLQRTTSNALDNPSFDVYGTDFISLVFGIEPNPYYDTPSSKNRVPLDWETVNSSHIPLYLSTQRLRI